MTADGEVAPLVAHIALDYAGGAFAERRGERSPSPVVVVETERRDDAIRGRLAPFAWRNAVTYVDAEGEDVSLQLPRIARSEDADAAPPQRQRLTERFIRQARAVAAVVVSAPDDARPELEVLVHGGLETVVLGRTMIDRRVRDLLQQHDLERWMDRLEHWRHRFVGLDDPQRRADVAMPYAYLAQRLAARWASAPMEWCEETPGPGTCAFCRCDASPGPWPSRAIARRIRFR